jgi:hypothetical protein
MISFLIEGHLKESDGLHANVVCKNISDKVDNIIKQKWIKEDYDSFI